MTPLHVEFGYDIEDSNFELAHRKNLIVRAKRMI
jgi:hypothetical protein